MMLNSRPAKYDNGFKDLTDKNQVNPLIRCYIHLFNILLTSTLNLQKHNEFYLFCLLPDSYRFSCHRPYPKQAAQRPILGGLLGYKGGL